MKWKKASRYPQAKSQTEPRLYQPGLFSLLRASSPRTEPGDLACLGEAVSCADSFSRMNGSKQTAPARPPTRQASVSSGRSRLLRCREPTPTANAAPCLLSLRGATGFPRCASFALRLARAPRPTPVVNLHGWVGALASLPRWQSASSPPTRAGRRILLDLSGVPGEP